LAPAKALKEGFGASINNRKGVTFSSFEKRNGTFQYQRFEVRCLLMVEKRLLALVLLIEHKLILIVARSVNDELQVSRLPTHFLG
jgi:hypothetical protein